MTVRMIGGKRCAKILSTLEKDYAELLKERFGQHGHTFIVEGIARMTHFTKEMLPNGNEFPSYTVWLQLYSYERSLKDVEVALGILEQDRRTSGPRWEEFYGNKS